MMKVKGLRVILGLCRDNGKCNGNSYLGPILGLYRDNGTHSLTHHLDAACPVRKGLRVM